MTDSFKYKIKIAYIEANKPRPWEWSCYRDNETEPYIVGSKATEKLALDEATTTIELDLPE